MKLEVHRLGPKWWITGDEEFGPYGPYPNRKEAVESKRGLLRTMKHEGEPGYFTCEEKRGLRSDED